MSSTYDIDFVVTWVDGGDENWLKEKAKYNPYGDTSAQRYRDWDIFRYWFRGVDKFAPWVRKVHFITWGHLPSWLDTDNPKLHIVKHTDYMPPEYLPCFNSNAIEMNMHRIEGLSEHFVYFNDDMHIIDYVKPTDFFRDGKPVDMLALQPVIANPDSPVMSYTYFNNSNLLCKYFNKYECMKKHRGQFFKIGYPLKYFVYNLLETAFPMFTGFYDTHGPAPMMLSTFRELWECEGELLDAVSRHRFRTKDDVSQYIFRNWEKLKGNFVPVNLHRKNRYIEVSEKNADKLIRRQVRPMVCINDSYLEYDFEEKKKSMQDALSSILPDKCSFEK